MGVIHDKIAAEVAAREGLKAAEGNFTGRDGKTWRVEKAAKLPTGHLVELRAPTGDGRFFPIGAKGVETELVYVTGKVPTNRVTGFNARGEPIVVADEAGALQRIAAMAVENKRDEKRVAKPGSRGTTEHVIFPGGTGDTTSGYGSAEWDNNNSPGQSLVDLVAGTPDESLENFGADFQLGRLFSGTTTDEYRIMRNGGMTCDLATVGSDTVTAASVYLYERTSVLTFADADLQAVIRTWGVESALSANYGFALGDFARSKYGNSDLSDTVIDFNPVSEPYTIALNAAGLAHLQAFGGSVVGIGFMLKDIAAVSLDGTWAASKDKKMTCYGTDQSGDTLDIRLNVTSEPAASGSSMVSPMNMVTRLG